METAITSNWVDLEGVLYELYREWDIEESYDRDSDYLRKAYFSIEELWSGVLKAIPEIRFVLLAEAPLYGPNKSYFYNPAAGATEFFNYVNAEALVGPLPRSSRKVNGIRPRKKQMIDRLTQKGILIVDIFPYAFKPDFTAVDYRKLAKTDSYKRLCLNTVPLHFTPKLEALRSNLNDDAQFAFRYAGVHDHLEDVVLNAIRNEVAINCDSIPSVHDRRNMDTDKVVAFMASQKAPNKAMESDA